MDDFRAPRATYRTLRRPPTRTRVHAETLPFHTPVLRPVRHVASTRKRRITASGGRVEGAVGTYVFHFSLTPGQTRTIRV